MGRDDDRTALLGGNHHLSLERRAALALTSGDFQTAFRYADRRCRIFPPPTSHSFVLRAHAAWRLGHHDAALDDLAEALEIGPSDLSANRRMLAWAKEECRKEAAARLIADEHDPAILQNAIGALRDNGEQYWASVSIVDSHVSGWVAWATGDVIEAAILTEEASLTSVLEADPRHPLATGEIQATNFRLRRPPSRASQRLALKSSGVTFLERRLPPNVASLRQFRPGPNKAAQEKTPPTVIVPVYADREATIACFESLLKAGAAFTKEGPSHAHGSFRILAVDDASPEPALRQYLVQLARENRIELLVNSENLGFIGSINRALDELSQGDVVLLNADTLVPPGFVERLAEAAYSQRDIGTATPLSNNGDIFSFPRPGYVNPMPTYDEMVALDRAAAAANSTVVDTLSGIGFCLYITRRCLDSVGGLSERFERGYLEDVDFCLRARERGFRNICASSVYVAHHGSKSFKGEKRGLVLRNLAVMDERFPSFRKECLAFEATDPLGPVRATLEQALIEPAQPSVLIASASGAGLATAQARAQQLSEQGDRAILIVRDKGALSLKAFDGCPPQGIRVNLDLEADSAELLQRLRPVRLEIVDPLVSPGLLKLARRLHVPVDLWITADHSLSHIDAASRLFAPTEIAAAFVRAKLPACEPLVASWPSPQLFLEQSAPGAKVLGIVPSSPSVKAWHTIRALSIHFQCFDEAVQIVVAGQTADDQTLMTLPNVFITGQVEAKDLGKVLAPINPAWLLTDFEHPLFGHPIIETVRSANCRVAFRDWSFGRTKARERDLAIRADASDAALAEAIAQWMDEA